MAQTFLQGVTNRNTGVSRRDIQVFDPQAWQSRLRRDTWQVYVQWNPVNMVTNGPKKLAVLMGWLHYQGRLKFHDLRVVMTNTPGRCFDYGHAWASSVSSSKDNRNVKLTRQDFLPMLPDCTANSDLLFTFSSNILDFRRSLSSSFKIWLAARRPITILSLAGLPLDPKILFRSL